MGNSNRGARESAFHDAFLENRERAREHLVLSSEVECEGRRQIASRNSLCALRFIAKHGGLVKRFAPSFQRSLPHCGSREKVAEAEGDPKSTVTCARGEADPNRIARRRSLLNCWNCADWKSEGHQRRVQCPFAQRGGGRGHGWVLRRQ
jgi:hypothetical protein